jgi:hypothetical protein
VQALKVGKNGKATRVIKSVKVRADVQKLVVRLPSGTYRFRVAAVNDVGDGHWSALSNAVTSR